MDNIFEKVTVWNWEKGMRDSFVYSKKGRLPIRKGGRNHYRGHMFEYLLLVVLLFSTD